MRELLLNGNGCNQIILCIGKNWQFLFLQNLFNRPKVCFRADYRVTLWLSWYCHYQRNPYYDTITIKGLISWCITILSAFPNQMNFIDFIKIGLPVKIPSITALWNISFAIILTNIFASRSFLFSYFVNLDRKASEWYYRRRKYTGSKTVKAVGSWRDYRW